MKTRKNPQKRPGDAVRLSVNGGNKLGGTFSAFLNHVLLLISKNEFEEVVKSIQPQKVTHIPEMPPLGELLPLGSISQPDEKGCVSLKKWNFQNFRCDPLVAVTSSHEKMVAACKSMESQY